MRTERTCADAATASAEILRFCGKSFVTTPTIFPKRSLEFATRRRLQTDPSLDGALAEKEWTQPSISLANTVHAASSRLCSKPFAAMQPVSAQGLLSFRNHTPLANCPFTAFWRAQTGAGFTDQCECRGGKCRMQYRALAIAATKPRQCSLVLSYSINCAGRVEFRPSSIRNCAHRPGFLRTRMAIPNDCDQHGRDPGAR